MEEIRNVSFGLWGEELKEWQAIQRLVAAGFQDPRLLARMFAIIEGESGSYQRAWHANVMRLPADESDLPPYGGDIKRDAEGRMTIKSIDLGFIQRNVDIPDAVMAMTPEAMEPFVDGLFNKYPRLTDPWTAAEEAYALYLDRGFQPWYAYQPGTPAFKAKVKRGCQAVGNYLAKVLVDDGDKLVWKLTA